jgi:hypothetical protein
MFSEGQGSSCCSLFYAEREALLAFSRDLSLIYDTITSNSRIALIASTAFSAS